MKRRKRRIATDDEQKILSHYAGWGGIRKCLTKRMIYGEGSIKRIKRNSYPGRI
ncbi:MAG: hypothetical protein ACLUEN_00140 [Coprococcus sp.]